MDESCSSGPGSKQCTPSDGVERVKGESCGRGLGVGRGEMDTRGELNTMQQYDAGQSRSRDTSPDSGNTSSGSAWWGMAVEGDCVWVWGERWRRETGMEEGLDTVQQYMQDVITRDRHGGGAGHRAAIHAGCHHGAGSGM